MTLPEKGLEERIRRLEEANRQLEHKIGRTKDYVEIHNLASRYQYYHQLTTMPRTFELFAQQTPGVAVIVAPGVFEGVDQVRAFWNHIHPTSDTVPVDGVMTEHQLTTPIIQVAEDRQTAKAVWMSPGHETVPALIADGQWVWDRYAMDFVREGGQWKIWHFWVCRVFRTRYNRDWAEGPEPPPTTLMPHFAKYPPTRLPPSFNSYYSPDKVREMEPVPPDPYVTFEPYHPVRDVDPEAGAVGVRGDFMPPPR